MVAQTIGGRLGYGAMTLNSAPAIIQSLSGVDTFTLSLDPRSGSIYAGLFYRQPIFSFLFLEAETLLSGYDYPMTIARPEWNGGNITKHERIISSDISLAAGLRAFRALRVQGGVKAHYLFNAQQRMVQFEPAYSNDWDRWTTSYFGTVGLDIVNLTLDFTYGVTAQGLGDNLQLFGQGYDLAGRRETFAVKLGVRIGGRNLRD